METKKSMNMKNFFFKLLYYLFGYQSKLYNDQKNLILTIPAPEPEEAFELTNQSAPVVDHYKGPHVRRSHNNRKHTKGRKRQIIHFIKYGRATSKSIEQ